MGAPFEELRAALADRYALEVEIGRGGMATVFLAGDLKHGRRVALKVLHPELTAALGAERFLREIEIVARLSHPHILPLYDSGRTNGFFYFVMPYVEGESLRQRLERELQLPIGEALGIARAVASALGYAHSHGVVHRDVKPENILFSGGEPVVADFGIARAVTMAGSERLTRTGIVVGTPAYMSPEQATGEDVDARSDIYGLGCVLYEMLAGEPPFMGRTRAAVIVRQLSERPPSLKAVRPGLPPRVESIVETALAKSPADRFATAEELANALGEAAKAPTVPGQEADRRWPPLRWIVPWGAALAVLLVALIPRLFQAEPPNPAHYLVGLLTPAEATDREALPVDVFRHQFETAMRQVPGIGVLDPMRVNDRLMRAGAEPKDLSSWMEGAQALDAAHLVTLRTVPLPSKDSVEVVAELRDVGRGTLIDRAGVRLSLAGGEDLASPAAALVERLFDLPQGAISTRGSENDESMRAFVAGHEALKTWRLEAAQERFSEAVRLDPDFARANFWLAQTAAWAGEAPEEWSGWARRAAARSAEMADGREAALARGLVALADARFPVACETYGELVAADSLDFHAWFGLGECHRRDQAVVGDAKSPSGWTFRGSYQSAVEAYERALEIAPSFNFARREAATRLEELLFAEPHQIRLGRALPPDTGSFAAYPALDSDTLAFVPWPAAELFAGKPGTEPPTRYGAVEENRKRLLRLVESWAASFPDSPAPYRALARALELRQALEGAGETSALSAVRRARELSETPEDSLAAALTEVRLLLKLERFGEAGALATRTLEHESVSDPEKAHELRGLAALLGRPQLAARLGVAAARQVQTSYSRVLGEVPLRVYEAREAFLAFAAVGAPGDSVRFYAAHLDALLDLHLRGAAGQTRCQLLGPPLALASVDVDRTVADDACWDANRLLEIQWNLGRGDTARARLLLLGEVRRADGRPAAEAIDRVHQRARLLAQIGDTVVAVGHLDRAFGVLPALGTAVTREPAQAAGLVRAMALRAELAARTGDEGTARRRAEAVLALWGGTEEEGLRPLIRRMRALARGETE